MEWLDIRRELPWLAPETIHLIAQDAEAQLSAALSARGFVLVVLDGAKIEHEQQFFAEAAQAFGFPPHFGRNWDAFHDCFGELAYRDARRLAVIWRNASHTLSTDLYVFLKGVHELLVAARDAAMVEGDDIEPLQVEVFLLGSLPQFRKRPH